MNGHDPVASTADGSYPRPQLVRPAWGDLGGEWTFAYDDADRGRAEHWEKRELAQRIMVPFPPESIASGIADTGFHPVLWYQRQFDETDLRAAGYEPGRRILLHFGAVDYRCRVWIDGNVVAEHEGGHVPFTCDVTDSLMKKATHTLVVRVEDDPEDLMQPRGKQDWREDPHGIWYHRTSGIWQPVWLESVPDLSIAAIAWSSDIVRATTTARITLSRRPMTHARISVTLCWREDVLASVTTTVAEQDIEMTLSLPGQTNGQAHEEILWSPDNPTLVDAAVVLDVDGASETDRVWSYFGLRSIGVSRRSLLLNHRPFFMRAVLSQGYWPQSHLALPSSDAARREVELIKELGFNAARLHQKFEDPRFLFWADRLGIMVWGEAPAALSFGERGIHQFVSEWMEIVARDSSHPSVIAWVPLNESWGVAHIAENPQMQHYARALVELTKALDPTRPVVSNDGWEQVDTDIVGIHDYTASGTVLEDRYGDDAAVARTIADIGPAGRRAIISGEAGPVMLTEFGGVSFDVESTGDTWGYSRAASAKDFANRLRELFQAVNTSTGLAGFCYTQLTDTLQETNGLVDAQRSPKLPARQIHKIVTSTFDHTRGDDDS